MYSEVAWVLVSSVTKVQAQVILDPDYFPDYPSFSYDCDLSKDARKKIVTHDIFKEMLRTFQY